MARKDRTNTAQEPRRASRARLRGRLAWITRGVGVAFALAATLRVATCRAANPEPALAFPGASLVSQEVANALLPADFNASSFSPVPLSAPASDGVPSPSLPRALPGESLDDDALPEPIYRGALVSDFPISPFRKRVFGYGVGSFAEQDAGESKGGVPGFKTTTWLGGAGQDWNVLEQSVWGFGAQGGEVKVEPKANGTYDNEITSFSGNLHMSIFGALWRFDALFGMAKAWNNQHSYSRRESNKFSSSQWLLAAEFGARFDKGYTRIEPLIGLQILNLNEPTKADKFISSDSYMTDFADASYRGRIGARFRWERDVALATLKPYIQATWTHEFGSREIFIAGDLSPFPIAYRYGGRKKARDQFDLSGGIGAALRDSLDLDAKYDVKFGKDYVEYMFYVGFNKKY